MKPRKKPLRRRKPILRRKTPVRQTRPAKMSAKRRRESREYTKLRVAFLEARPICAVWLAENGWTQTRIDWFAPEYARPCPTMAGGVDVCGLWSLRDLGAPASTDVHHREGRGRNYLNTDTWLAVSREGHLRIHAEPKWARAHGFLK